VDWIQPSSSGPDLSAHDAAMRLSFSELAGELSELLGARLVAYLGGVNEKRAVHQWSEGVRSPSVATQNTLRDAKRSADPSSRIVGTTTSMSAGPARQSSALVNQSAARAAGRR
jgi:hypothetical protein